MKNSEVLVKICEPPSKARSTPEIVYSATQEKFIAEIKAVEKRGTQKIEESQKDTIEILIALLHERYTDHENRIRQLEQDHEFLHSHR